MGKTEDELAAARFNEARQTLNRWNLAIGSRWISLHDRMNRAGIKTDSLSVKFKEATIRISDIGVGIYFDAGNDRVSIQEFPNHPKFEPSMLGEVREKVIKKLSDEEARFERCAKELPAAVEPFRIEIAEDELEKNAKTAVASKRCECGHMEGEHLHVNVTVGRCRVPGCNCLSFDIPF
jgi:hypothetical protein